MKMLNITLFTDPMMGLSYESEPFLRRLETHFPHQIRFTTVMGGLVRSVYDWLDPQELTEFGDAEAIRRYNARLAKIYEAEQNITGLPIKMPKLDLFAPERPSSLPLNLAYKAAQLADIGKADAFLYRLRYATIVEVRSTNDLEVILDVVRTVGIDEKRFLQHYQNGAAQLALEQDFAYRQALGIRGLPAYLLEMDGKKILLNGVVDFDGFAQAICQLSDGKLTPQAPTLSEQTLANLLAHHPLISLIELQHAFQVDENKVRSVLAPFITRGEVRWMPNPAFVCVA